MKMLTAVIKPYKLDGVREALIAIGVQGMTVTEAKGFGQQEGRSEQYRGMQYVVDFIPKIRIEAAVNDEQLELAVEAIVSAARTGDAGDGQIFITALEQVVRIRTGEVRESAL